MTLTYAIEQTAPYRRAAVLACVAKACDAWSKGLSGYGVRFQPIDEDEDLADITFRFGRALGLCQRDYLPRFIHQWQAALLGDQWLGSFLGPQG
jgi:hypothetical protein